MMPDRSSVSFEAIDHAATALLRGDLVIFPTETVYGLGADARCDRAVAQIFALKGRPHFNPLIVHVASIEAARQLGRFDTLADRLAAAFWPGPLTLVVPKRDDCGISLACAGQDMIALRVPAHPVARELLERSDVPIAAPSANLSGSVSPTQLDHIAPAIRDHVAVQIDAGACSVGVESTIIGCGLTAKTALLLRPGGVTREAIMDLAINVQTSDPTQTIKVPGSALRHYAPKTKLRVNATTVKSDEALLSFGTATLSGAALSLNLSPTGNMIEAAANLFAMLHRLDRAACRTIAVMPVPESGLGVAINDRLRRASEISPC